MVEITGVSNEDEFFKQLNLSKSSCTSNGTQQASHAQCIKQSRRTRSKAASSCKITHDDVLTKSNIKVGSKQTRRISTSQDSNHDQEEDTESDLPSSDSDTSDSEVITSVNSVDTSAQRKMINAEIERGTDHAILRSEEALRKELKSPPYTCTVKSCQESIGNWRKFVRHIREHRSCYPYSCTKCEAKFRCRMDLLSHLKRHFGLRNISCEICGLCFEKKRSLVSHMIVKHNQEDDRPRNFRCTECGEAFLQKCAVDRHMRFHTGFRPEACKFCNASFHTEYDLKEHIRIHTGEKPFQCDHCNYCARTSQLLKRHKKSHSSSKPFTCDKCDFKCNNGQSLKRHKVKHSGNLPYKCPYCDYRCRDMDNLKKHIRKVKKHKGLKIYPCNNCKFSSDDSSSYLKHLKQYHTPNLDLRTAKATKLCGILLEDQQSCPDISESHNIESPATGNHMEFFDDRYTMTCTRTSEESLYPHSRGDILLSSTAFDNNDGARNVGAFPSGLSDAVRSATLQLYSSSLLFIGSFNESTCWVPAVCRGLSAPDKGDIHAQECIAILIEPTADQEIEIHHSDVDVKFQLKTQDE